MANISFWFFKPKLPKNFDTYSERGQFLTLSEIGSVLEARSKARNIVSDVYELLRGAYAEEKKKRLSDKDLIEHLELSDLISNSEYRAWDCTDSPKRLLKKIVQKVYKIATKKYTGEFESEYIIHRMDCWDKWEKWQDGKPVCFGLFMAKKD